MCPYCDRSPIVFCTCRQDKYGFFSFIWDVFMVFITCGLWLIWIFVREMRKLNR